MSMFLSSSARDIINMMGRECKIVVARLRYIKKEYDHHSTRRHRRAFRFDCVQFPLCIRYARFYNHSNVMPVILCPRRLQGIIRP